MTKGDRQNIRLKLVWQKWGNTETTEETEQHRPLRWQKSWKISHSYHNILWNFV